MGGVMVLWHKNWIITYVSATETIVNQVLSKII